VKITQSGGQTERGPADWFTGDVYIDTIKNPDDQSAIGCAHVRFTPGARTAWHSHPKGQTLYVTDGIGLVSYRGGEVVEIRPGDGCTSNPARSIGMEPHQTASWPTSPCKKPTTKARS
jgi:quercetin dioxygenase-like cupin family protein